MTAPTPPRQGARATPRVLAGVRPTGIGATACGTFEGRADLPARLPSIEKIASEVGDWDV